MTSYELDNLIWGQYITHCDNGFFRTFDERRAFEQGFREGFTYNSEYWTSVKDKEANGWCNVLLCHFDEIFVDGKPVRKYDKISFSMGIQHKSDNIND